MNITDTCIETKDAAIYDYFHHPLSVDDKILENFKIKKAQSQR